MQQSQAAEVNYHPWEKGKKAQNKFVKKRGT